MLYDVIIIGAGPAGSAAAVYAARKKLKTLLIADSFGGQSVVSDDIQNWIGEKHISGFDLAKKLEDHVRFFSDSVDIRIPEKAVKIKKINCKEKNRICDFLVETNQNNLYKGKAVILASGARYRRLGVDGEDRLQGRGVVYCSTCDAPLFKGKDVAVIGGGNAGVEAVIDLLQYAKKIYLLQRSNKLKADLVSQEKINKNKKVQLIFNAETVEILGKKTVSELKYKNIISGKINNLPVSGVFVEIGSVPNSEIAKDLVKLDKYGQVVTDAKHSSTSCLGIFAAGDITDNPYKQNNISAGDGIKAALAAYAYILGRKKQSPCQKRKDCL